MKMSDRTLRMIVLGAWAAFMVWLLSSGEVDRYIGPRTLWVVGFGAFALVVIAFLYAGLAGAKDRPPGGRDAAGILVLLVPIVAVLAIPTPSLGSLAASRKLSAGSIVGAVAARPAPGDEVSFAEIEYASESEEYAAAAGIVDGYEVELTGFVTQPPDLQAGQFALTRFAIFCCAADVVPHSVPVDPGGEFLNFNVDRWLTIRGVLEERNGALVLVAQDIKPVPEPANPYIR